MNKKILAIFLVGMFLLTGVSGISISTNPIIDTETTSEEAVLPPIIQIIMPSEGMLHVNGRQPKFPGLFGKTTIIGWCPFEIKVRIIDPPSSYSVRAFHGDNPFHYVLLEETFPGSDIYTGIINKWIFGLEPLIFVVTDDLGNSNSTSMDVLFIYFPRRSM